ncbi:MAG: hypothetical protein ABI878_04330 [Acidobacteriota bacterium]
MRNRFGPLKNNCVIASAFSILAICSFEQVPAQSIETAVIHRFISQQAKRENGEEYKQARKLLKGDINGDKKKDIVVLYTLEGFNGSNNYRQYLAVFLGTGKGFRYAAKEVVGEHAGRGVELKSIIGGRINLDTMEPRKTDPACCPSKPGKARYLFAAGKLRELK